MNSAVLFAGGGVCDLGFPSPPKAVVDVDSWFLEAYRLNHPASAKRVQADLLTESAASVCARMNCRKLDLLWASPPCQGFSTARFVRGDRPRHAILRSLFLTPIDFAAIMRPEFVVVENVAGLLKVAPGPKFHRWLIDGLKGLGYAVDTWRLNSASFGEVQRRDRVFIVAKLRGKVPPPPVGGMKPGTLRDAIGHLTETEALANGVWPMSDGWRKKIAKVRPGERLTSKCQRRRMEWDKPIRPLMTTPCVSTSPIAIHPEQDRFLSVREYCCCFGVPGYKLPEMPIRKRYEVIGQSIQPALSRAVVEQLTKR